MHAHPELSGHEKHTKYLVKGILEANGYIVKEFDDNFGLIADLEIDKNAKRVAIRADMDALPIQEETNEPIHHILKESCMLADMTVILPSH